MTQHVPMGNGRVVHEYVADTLGAPFEVVLINSAIVDLIDGEEIVKIPDLNGLIGAVVRSRVLHTQKLRGPEIKFIRSALGVKAKSLAKFLDMTPENFSRCEAGVRILSPAIEKTLRLSAYMATLFEEPEALFKAGINDAAPKSRSDVAKAVKDFVALFFSMKIESVFDPHKPLRFDFIRRCRGEIEADGEGFEYCKLEAA